MTAKSAAERQRERLMAAATRRTEPDAAPAGKSALRSKPVRITVDLTPEDHRALRAWTSKAAEDLDMPRLTHAAAIRAMIRVCEADESVSAAVVEMIRRNKEDR